MPRLDMPPRHWGRRVKSLSDLDALALLYQKALRVKELGEARDVLGKAAE